jgi:hypothetical protein
MQAFKLQYKVGTDQIMIGVLAIGAKDGTAI